MGLPGGHQQPHQTVWVALDQAWPARTRRLARLVAVTAKPPDTVTSRKLVSQPAPSVRSYATWSSFPAVGLVSSAIEASLR